MRRIPSRESSPLVRFWLLSYLVHLLPSVQHTEVLHIYLDVVQGGMRNVKKTGRLTTIRGHKNLKRVMNGSIDRSRSLFLWYLFL